MFYSSSLLCHRDVLAIAAVPLCPARVCGGRSMTCWSRLSGGCRVCTRCGRRSSTCGCWVRCRVIWTGWRRSSVLLLNRSATH